MLERRRQQYLSILEIDNYFPRRILPGAAESTLLSDEHFQTPEDQQPLKEHSQLQQDADIESYADENRQADEVTDNQSQPISPLEVLGEATSETASSGLVEPKIEEAVVQKTIEFVLTVWRIKDECLIIDSREPGTALPTDRLLQNILRSIDLPLAQLPKSELIRWPLFSNQSIKAESEISDADQARAMVQAYIHAQISKSAIKFLFLMGENATAFTLDDTVAFSEVQGELLQHPSWDTQVLIMPSLHSMLQEPLQKKLTWNALQKILS
jgi:hypothetical protein